MGVLGALSVRFSSTMRPGPVPAQQLSQQHAARSENAADVDNDDEADNWLPVASVSGGNFWRLEQGPTTTLESDGSANSVHPHWFDSSLDTFRPQCQRCTAPPFAAPGSDCKLSPCSSSSSSSSSSSNDSSTTMFGASAYTVERHIHSGRGAAVSPGLLLRAIFGVHLLIF